LECGDPHLARELFILQHLQPHWTTVLTHHELEAMVVHLNDHINIMTPTMEIEIGAN